MRGRDATVTFAPIPNVDLAPGSPIFAHFVYPIRADPKRSTVACGQLDRILRLRQADSPYRTVVLVPGPDGPLLDGARREIW